MLDKIAKQMAVASLRVNIKSLSAESIIIKKEFRRHKTESVRNSLYLHRVKDVRTESRITQLTLAAIKGIPYSSVERNAKHEPIWKKIIAKIDRHSQNHQLKAKVGEWCLEGKRYFQQLKS
jgi:hypothetical protein